MSLIGYAIGVDVLVVGVEDDPTEVYEDGSPCQRVYIGARWRNEFCVPVMADAKRVRDAWDGGFMGHLTMPRPDPSCVYVDDVDQQAPGGGS